MEKISEARAKELAALVFGSYPKSEAPMPEIYAEQLKNQFAQHSEAVAMKVANEVVLEYRTLPAIANVAALLNNETNLLTAGERAERQRLLRIEEDKKFERTTPPPTEEQKARAAQIVKETVASLKANEPNRPDEKPRPNLVPMSKEREEEAFRNIRKMKNI